MFVFSFSVCAVNLFKLSKCCVCIAVVVVVTVIAAVTAVAAGQSQLSLARRSLNAANALANCTNFELINITLNLAKLGKVMA